LKALDPLAVAERDILALRTARENRATLRRLHERERASPFQSTRTAPHPLHTGPHRDRGRPHTSPADCDARACASHPSHGFVARMKARDSARHRNRTAGRTAVAPQWTTTGAIRGGTSRRSAIGVVAREPF